MTSARLAARGLAKVGDLLFFLPRAYDDLRRATPIERLGALPDGATVLVRGTIARVSVFPRRLLDVYVQEGDFGPRVRARWFRVPGGMSSQFVKGAEVALAGPLRRTAAGQVELTHPTNLTARLVAAGATTAAGTAAGLGIRPRYPMVPGVAGRVMEKIVAAAVARFSSSVPEILPAEMRERHALPPAPLALRTLHLPSDDIPAADLDALLEGTSAAHRRIALEDLLIVQLGLGGKRRAARAEPGRACAADPEATSARVRAALPFTLTAAQERAIAEIARDMRAPRPMQRLLQGDVGSGKTAVAFAAAAQAAASGGQTLFMAPTEVLAEQQARTLRAYSARLGMRVALLTASTRRPVRESLLALARAGAISILVGTQALLDEGVTLGDFALAVIDEQHRFGVAQRARLRQKGWGGGGPTGAALPHLLVMTATPIPRTLALTLYGDLDVTTLGELPPGRRPTETRIFVGDAERERAYDAVRAAIAAGHQSFVVCPVLSESERAGAVTAVARHAELRRSLVVNGRPARVGLVHGQLDASEKEAVLRCFRDAELDVLVATTVIEVGIDVPNASVMIVEEADRFGMAQLHQLRGRVGRGPIPGACLLCTRTGAGEALERLRVVADTSDGFRIAEADLRMRGHGDLFGARQSGMPRLRFADLASYAGLLEIARAEAIRIMESDPRLERPEHAGLKRAVEVRWSSAAAPVYGEEGG